jgi:hypothetical protein
MPNENKVKPNLFGFVDFVGSNVDPSGPTNCPNFGKEFLDGVLWIRRIQQYLIGG